MKSYKLFLKFLRFIKPYWAKETLLFGIMILASFGTLVSPYILMKIIDEILPSKDLTYLLQILALLVGINIVRILLDLFSNYLYSWVSNHIILDIRTELFKRIMYFPLSFFDKNKTGDITHRINDEVNAVEGMLTGTLIRIIRNLITFIGLAIALCLLNYKLFLIAIAIIPLTLISTAYFKPKIHNWIKKSREKDADILDFFVERFSNIKLIKSYVSYNSEQNKLNSKGTQLIEVNLKASLLQSSAQSISTFLVTLTPLIVLAWGGHGIIIGTMTIGALIAFIQYLNRLFNPISDSMNLYWEMVRASVSLKRIFEFLELPTEPMNNKAAKISLDCNVKFQNITFKYDGEIVLQNFNLELESGKSYAIVGASGCGKSTLINLLCQFYKQEEGTIFFGSKNIDEINLHSLRNRIALISQENQLFHDSIIGNIQYGNIDSIPSEIERAIRTVGLNDFLNILNEGMESVIGNEGTKISGGQKQRITIARAILKESDIIILDEATSALDSESETQIITNITRLYRNKLILIISHRLSAIKGVDEIIYMNKGKVVEKGKYEDLLSKQEAFFELFKQQITVYGAN